MRGSDTWNATCSPAAAFSRPRPPTWTHSLARVRDRIAATGRAGIAAITADVETAQRRGEIRADIEARQLAFELHAYAMEANWALLLLDDDGAGERARTAIDAALARVGTTQEGVES